MLKYRLIFSIALLFTLLSGLSRAEDSSFRPRLGCIPFAATSLRAMAFTEDISSSLLSSIDRSRSFEIVERKKIEHYLELEGLRLDNLDHESIIKIGVKAGLDYVVHGSVSAHDSGTILEINLLDVQARKVIMKESYRMSQINFSTKLVEIVSVIVNKVKEGGIQAQATASTKVNEPVEPPRGLEVTGTVSSIRLSWHSDMKRIAGFNVYRSNTSDGQYRLHATTPGLSFTDENMKLNEVFYYKVAAVRQDGSTSELTLPVRGATAIAPPPPIFMNIEPDIKGARLVWRTRSGAGGDSRTKPHGYKVYRRQGDDGAFSLIARLPVDALTYADKNLGDGLKYVYTITSHNSEGAESEYSAKLSIVPLPTPNPVRVISGNIRFVSLSWDRYAHKEAEGYKVFRSDRREGSYTEIAKLRGADATNYVDRGRNDNTSYWYRVSVFNGAGVETDASEPVSAVTRDIPPTPLNLTAISGQPRMVTLKWQVAGTAADDIKSVIIYKMLDEKDVNLEKIGEVPADQTVFVDNKHPLEDKTRYYYRLCAKNSGGAVSMQTATVSAVTKATPKAPENVSASSGEVKKTVVKWDKNLEADIEEYHVFMKRAGDTDFKLLRKLSGNSLVESDLKDGAEYSYKIRAVDKDGLISGFSNSVTVRTKPLPAAVTGLSVLDPAKRAFTWQSNKEKDVHNYNVYKKGFMDGRQKLATVQDTKWQTGEHQDSLEIFVTAIDDSGLESEPSGVIVFKKH